MAVFVADELNDHDPLDGTAVPSFHIIEVLHQET